MKKKLSLLKLSENELKENEMKKVNGGALATECTCCGTECFKNNQKENCKHAEV